LRVRQQLPVIAVDARHAELVRQRLALVFEPGDGDHLRPRLFGISFEVKRPDAAPDDADPNRQFALHVASRALPRPIPRQHGAAVGRTQYAAHAPGSWSRSSTNVNSVTSGGQLNRIGGRYVPRPREV